MNPTLLFASKHLSCHDLLIKNLNEYGIKVIPVNCDINEIELSIINNLPNIILLEINNDIVDDFINMVNGIKSLEYPPVIFTISSYENFAVNESLFDVGIEFAFTYPYVANNVCDLLIKHYKYAPIQLKKCRDDLIFQISDFLREYDINSGMDGFWYLRYAIYLCCCSKNPKPSLSRIVYPQIAEKFKCSCSSIEWVIRQTINRHSSVIINVLNSKFHITYDKKPTNSNFINFAVQIISEEIPDVVDRLKNE